MTVISRLQDLGARIQGHTMSETDVQALAKMGRHAMNDTFVPDVSVDAAAPVLRQIARHAADPRARMLAQAATQVDSRSSIAQQSAMHTAMCMLSQPLVGSAATSCILAGYVVAHSGHIRENVAVGTQPFAAALAQCGDDDERQVAKTMLGFDEGSYYAQGALAEVAFTGLMQRQLAEVQG
jgi:hypothetical protein